jgi:hypothetical protein
MKPPHQDRNIGAPVRERKIRSLIEALRRERERARRADQALEARCDVSGSAAG